MKPYCLLLYSLMVTLPLLKAESLDPILPSMSRQEVIEEAEYYRQYPIGLEVLDVSQVHFHFSSKETSISNRAEDTKAPALELKSFNPEELLSYAASVLNPRGIMMRKGVYYLVLPKKPVPAGTRLKISLDGAPYMLLLETVYPKAYTLQYQDTKKTFILNPSPSEKALKK